MSHTFAERGNPGGICTRSAVAVADDDDCATVMAFARIYGNEVRAQGFRRLNVGEEGGGGPPAYDVIAEYVLWAKGA